MNEKDLINKLKESAEEITPPESLSPDAVERMLSEQPAPSRMDRGKKPSGRYRLAARISSAAAIFLLSLTVAWQAVQLSRLDPEKQELPAEPAGQLETVTAVNMDSAAETETDANINSTADSSSTKETNQNLSAEAEGAEAQELSSETQSSAEQTSASGVPGQDTDQDSDSEASSQNTEQNPLSETSGQNTKQDAASQPLSQNAEQNSLSEASGQDTKQESASEALSQNAEQSSLSEASGQDTDQDSDTASRGSTGAEAAGQTKDSLPGAGSYEEIYRVLREHFYYEDSDMRLYDVAKGADTGVTMEMEAKPSAAQNEMAVMEDGVALDTVSGGGTADFSETNRQEAGVDEADIIKTDGEYLYILRRDCSLAIVRADKASSECVSITQLEDQDNGTIQEMYLDGDLLHIIVTGSVTSLENSLEDVYYTSTKQQTILYTYDISDRRAPALTGTVTQDGFYADSRKVGSFIYLFSSWYPEIADTYENSTIIPRINQTEAAAADFYVPDYLSNSTYLVISSVNAAQPDQVQDSKILVSGASQFYVSTENIYIANTSWKTGAEQTEITKFHYENGQISGVAAGAVRGYLNNSFSMNEHNGYLRVVSTWYGDATKGIRNSLSRLTGLDLSLESDWEERNGLTVFDENMRQTGSINDLALGETIRSARFFGDTGYFVTFRQTDPLFSVDLSDPANPQILGELKISGFSSYLHFYGEDLLLGIGYEADESTGITSGLKLSMFDISDPTNVTEISRFIIPGITWCPAIEDYKAILVSPEKNLIGFFCDNRYLTFSWDKENGFSQDLVYDFYSDQLTGAADYYNMRGLYIDDTLYLAGETFVLSFNMEENFEKTGLLALTEVQQ